MQIFCRQAGLVLLWLVINSSLALANTMDRRQDNIGVKEIHGSYGNNPFVFGVVDKSPNFVAENCTGSDNDWALEFDISSLRNHFSNFDVNNIYVDGTGWSGEIALGAMKKISKHDNGTQRLLSLQHGHWSGDKVSLCVGSKMQLVASEYVLEHQIYLWYNSEDKRVLHNIMSNDICTANGDNWLLTMFEVFQQNMLNSEFCGSSNNKGILEFDTQNHTATIISNVPVQSNGQKSLTISFSQAGVISTQVKNGIGKGYGGNANGGTNGTGSGYDPDPNGDTWAGYDHHVGLKYMKIGKKSSDDWDGSKVWPI